MSVNSLLLYQDFNEQFEGYTQRHLGRVPRLSSCFIRISMSNLKDIHNGGWGSWWMLRLLYQDFNEQFEGYTQRLAIDGHIPRGCFIRISMSNLKDIHNYYDEYHNGSKLLYQDFNEQFEGYTQQRRLLLLVGEGCFIRISMSNLKDIHNDMLKSRAWDVLLYQDFNEQFEGYTQRKAVQVPKNICCFIRISMSNLKDIHNWRLVLRIQASVALSGFQ